MASVAEHRRGGGEDGRLSPRLHPDRVRRAPGHSGDNREGPGHAGAVQAAGRAVRPAGRHARRQRPTPAPGGPHHGEIRGGSAIVPAEGSLWGRSDGHCGWTTPPSAVSPAPPALTNSWPKPPDGCQSWTSTSPTSTPTRHDAAAGVPTAARAGPEIPTRRPLDHDEPPATRGPDAAELKEIRTACPHLDAAARHVRDFAEMLHDLGGDQLLDWMERVLADDLPVLHSLVSGLRRDFDAATAGLSTPWSSGQVEGHVTRVELIKRMGYGRANLDLPRQRVLLGPRPCDRDLPL